jgi:hypothetical protein
MMMPDAIIEELHQVREQLAKEFNYDVFAIVADARAHQTETGHPVVSFAQPPATPTEPVVSEAESERRAA